MEPETDTIRPGIPEKLSFLFRPSRYKVIYGGRGSGKSVGAADALLIRATQEPLRILCARELQSSIRDSVHRLLADEIQRLGMDGFYRVQQADIRGLNGSEFIFKGLRHNVSEIRSTQGVNICWVEEAAVVSRASWTVLIPTIREPGSEIWMTFNPELEDDPTYQMFVVHPPPDCISVKLDWHDNPWFPDVLEREMEHLKEVDYDDYLTTYLGHCRQALQGAVYANEIRGATEEGRICHVPYDPTKPVHTFWDLGWADNTAIWFAQIVGFEYHAIDYLEGSQRTLADYLKELQGKPYVYGTDWLPHDAESKQMGTGRSIEELMRAAGRTVKIVPKLSVADGINAARTIFPNVWFDAEKCADGLQCLRRYRYDVDPDTRQRSRQPIHDNFSHGADAYRYMSLSLKERPATKLTYYEPQFVPSRTGWMR